jgi:hypothetical protein
MYRNVIQSQIKDNEDLQDGDLELIIQNYDKCCEGLKIKLGLDHPRYLIVYNNLSKAKNIELKEIKLNTLSFLKVAIPNNNKPIPKKVEKKSTKKINKKKII